MKRILALVLFFVLPVHLSAQVHIIIDSLPADTPPEDSIFLAGDFNQWNPSDTSYRFQKREDGKYDIELPFSSREIAFKCTRGSWQCVETDAQGRDIPNRVAKIGNDHPAIHLSIQGWKTSQPAISTRSAQVQILKKNFTIPQLGRQRRVWIYLPPDYQASGRRYPVLYVHDGQNVFDRATAFAKEWKMDETLDQMFEENPQQALIVVAIDHGDSLRLAEYSPWSNEKYGGGEGKAYVRFIKETLKPYVDEHFRTRTGSTDTGILGSSMGGLIAYYAALEYPETFGKAGVFSPSFWFNPEIYSFAEAKLKTKPKKLSALYLIVGALEGQDGFMAQDLKKMRALLSEQGYPSEKIFQQIYADGKHEEQFWQGEFAKAVRWLFFQE